MSPASDRHNRAAGAIYARLWLYEPTGGGCSYTDNAGFRCNLPHRKSFSPDAAYYTGPPGDKEFLPQAPDFAAEVRSDEDYGPKAELKLAAKRADYFAAGTKVVWDVDLDSNDVVRVYRAADPEHPTIYRRGEAAEAEPAVPGWTMAVDELFGRRD
jgi:Uma2 family endonuclease